MKQSEQDIEEVDALKKGMIEASGEIRTAECDSCGGDMFYDAETRKLKCKFCGHLEDIDFSKVNVKELSVDKISEEDFTWDIKAKVIVCKNCGGETIVEPTEETSYCSYCGSQHIMEEKNANMGMRPQGVIPYAISNRKAKELMDAWVKKRWLAPKDLKTRFMDKSLKSIYMPYWTFDSKVGSDYSVRIGDYYYVGSGDDRKRRTKWRNHSGHKDSFFDDILVTAIESKDYDLLKKIEPFHTQGEQVVDYKPEFLVGHQARKYTIMPDVAHGIARSIMAQDIQDEIKRLLPGDTYDSYNQRLVYSNESYKHILLPVYMAAYDYQQRIYNVLINGQTGEVQGKAPVSTWKVVGLIAIAILIIVIVMLISNG